MGRKKFCFGNFASVSNRVLIADNCEEVAAMLRAGDLLFDHCDKF